VRSVMISSNPGPLVIMTTCFIAFAAVYGLAFLMLGVATDEEREKVRRGFDRILSVVR